VHHFNNREGKRVVPGDFMEKRTDGPRTEMLAYICKMCGYDVLFPADSQNVAQVEMQLCEECFMDRERDML
jgi:hypothetical protein